MQQIIMKGIFLGLLAGSLLMGCTAKSGIEEESMKKSDVLEAVSGLTVTNIDGESVSVETLWVERTVALVFLRHFG